MTEPTPDTPNPAGSPRDAAAGEPPDALRRARPEATSPEGGRRPGPNLLRWLEIVPILWLALTLYAYAALVAPLGPLPERPAAVVAAERAALPLLALLALAAIIRYFGLRSAARAGDAPPAETSDHQNP